MFLERVSILKYTKQKNAFSDAIMVKYNISIFFLLFWLSNYLQRRYNISFFIIANKQSEWVDVELTERHGVIVQVFSMVLMNILELTGERMRPCLIPNGKLNAFDRSGDVFTLYELTENKNGIISYLYQDPWEW